MKIKSLQLLLSKNGDVGYIIPSCDEYQGEYIAQNARRLEYITGFTGSNGIAIIFSNRKNLFFTDGRYITQANLELDKEMFDIYNIADIYKFDWNNYPQTLYYNPKLFTLKQLDLFRNLNKISIDGEDLIDQILIDKPKKDSDNFWLYPEKYAGKSFEEKYEDLKKIMQKKGASYVLLTKSDSICWLLNIRGNDVPFNPVAHGYLLVGIEKIYFFTDLKKTEQICKLKNVEFYQEDKVQEFILSLKEVSVLYDTKFTPIFFANLFEKAGLNTITSEDPTLLPKSIKNAVEINYAIEGHKKDAIALTQFLRWVETTVQDHEICESDLAIKLEEFRSQQEGFLMSSFPAICGYKENGAIIHYCAKKGSDKHLHPEGLLLIDSGGQYLGCTTDVTRTICLGKPTEEQKKRYTQVLKGHIALMLINFPIGTTGEHLDALARQYLWMDGVNYPHSTGHGVGSCLNVHEGPQRISPAREFSHPLTEGMILSNEPGFYKEGEYGIRIENLVYVTKSKYEGFLKFENLTIVEYCDKLIDQEMLTHTEIEYLREYMKTNTK
jgi:Xaa-Pro aminopeptidase